MRTDATIQMNQKERRPVYTSVSDDVNLQVLSPASDPVGSLASYRLLDSTGSSVIDTGSATGFTTVPSKSVKVWWNPDLETLALAVGRYVVEFTFEVQAAGEAFTRRYVRRVSLRVN